MDATELIAKLVKQVDDGEVEITAVNIEQILEGVTEPGEMAVRYQPTGRIVWKFSTKRID